MKVMNADNGGGPRFRVAELRRWSVTIALIALFAWPMLRAWAAPPGEVISPMEQQVVDLVNAERAKVGRKPLKVNYSLQESAWTHNSLMVSTGCFSHQCPGEKRYDQRIAATGYKAITSGENIAWGQRSAAAVMEAWMNSAGHKKNILHKDFTDIGVAYDAKGPTWTQNFGAPVASYKTVTPPRPRTATPTPRASETPEPTETLEPAKTPLAPTPVPTDLVEPTSTNEPPSKIDGSVLFVPIASFGP